MAGKAGRPRVRIEPVKLGTTISKAVKDEFDRHAHLAGMSMASATEEAMNDFIRKIARRLAGKTDTAA